MKSVRALPPMALRAWLFGLELPCSRRLSRLRRHGLGDLCSLHDSQLQLGGPVGWAVRRGLPVRVPAGLATSLPGSSYGVWSSPRASPDSYLCPGHTFRERCSSQVACMVWRSRDVASPAAIQRLRGRRFSLFRPNGYVAVVTSGFERAAGRRPFAVLSLAME